MSYEVSPTLFLTDADVKAAFDWREAIISLRKAYATQYSNDMFPPRTMARGEGIWLRTLSGIAPDGTMMGAKLIAASPQAGYASYLIPLFDQQTMALTALLDGNAITGFRTAATSALAADLLSLKGPLRVAVIGSGFEAKNHVRALAAIRPIAHITVFSPNPASRDRFVTDLADLNLSIGKSESSESAVENVTLIICAARSRDESPTLLGAWLRPGVTVVSIGSTLQEQRELDPAAIEIADLIVADMPEEVVHDTGDMIAATAAGILFEDRLVSLGDVVSGHIAGRSRSDQIIIYKSVGGAIQDIVVAAECVRRAKIRGLGTTLPVSVTPVKKGK